MIPRHQLELLVVAIMAGLVIMMILARLRSDMRARKWSDTFTQRLDVLDKKVGIVREELEHRDLVMNARVNVLERRMAAYEAPDPMETLLDEEDE